MGDLTKNFNKREFACSCGCGEDTVSPRLVGILQSIRDITGKPINITSGFRCKKKNDQLIAEGSGAVPTSSHLRGLAVDFACVTSSDRHDFVAAALDIGINRIGIGKTFIHIDIDPDKAQGVIWVY